MLFTSIKFLFFLLVVALMYYTVPKKIQWWVLLAASYIFYFIAGSRYLPFIIFTTVSSYVVALAIDRNRENENFFLERESISKKERKDYKQAEKKKRFKILIVGLLLNFGVLAVLKYGRFVASNINSLIYFFNKDLSVDLPPLILPLGISFYTFQTMGYLIDVYRNKATAEKNIFKLALFVCFFPQLVQGPISRYSSLSEKLFIPHRAEWDNIIIGIIRICWGYFKKLVVADSLISVIGKMTSEPEVYGGAYVIFLIIVYSIEIYADFTGGIDIAIGIGKALGIELAENFDRPFASTSVREYFKRWHITLGAWFTDYVFYPLSITRPMQSLSKFCRSHLGNAVGRRVPVYAATIVTWALTGLWHGASWNFIVWGLLNSAVMLISQEMQPIYSKINEAFPRLAKSFFMTLCLRVQTFFIVGAIRLFDVYKNVPMTFKKIFSVFYNFSSWKGFFSGGLFELGVDPKVWILVAVSVILMAVSEALKKQDKSIGYWLAERPLAAFSCVGGLAVAIIIFGSYGIGFDASEFIYTQF